MAGFMLAMFPSSAVRVIESSSSKLVIFDPPYYTFAIQLFIMCAISAVGYFVFTRTQIYQEMRYKWWLPLLIGAFAALALGMISSRSYITLSRDTGKMTIRRWVCGIPMRESEISLSRVRRAAVENFSGARIITVVLTDGTAIQLGNFTDQGGQFGAVDAINQFIGSQSAPR